MAKIFSSGSVSCSHRNVVGGAENHESGQRTGQAHVLDAHLRRTVFADGDAAMSADDLQIHLRKSRGNAELLESLVHRKHRETGRERYYRRCEAGTNRSSHVLFDDAAFEETVWKCHRTRPYRWISTSPRPAPRRSGSRLLIRPALFRTIRGWRGLVSIRISFWPALCKLLERERALFFGRRGAVKFRIILHK